MDSYSLSTLAELTGSQLMGDPEYQIFGVEHLEVAAATQAAFCENPRYEKLLKETEAGVIFVPPSLNYIQGKNLLVHAHPSFAFQKVIELFLKTPTSGFPGVHPTAVIHESVLLADNVVVGPHATIDRDSIIGANTIIESGVSIGPQVTIGKDCHFYPNVVIREGTQIGNRVIIQPGAVIGSCGFGYFTSSKGEHLKLNQLGIVIIEDDVEIGANTTIDRARLKTTRIGKGTKIDNLVQIAHQVSIGEHNLIIAQVGIAGSTKTGRNVVIGGQAGVIGHVTISDGVMLAARSAVSKSIEKSGIYSGAPALPIKEFNEHFVQLRNFSKFVKKIKNIEDKLAAFEKQFTKESEV